MPGRVGPGCFITFTIFEALKLVSDQRLYCELIVNVFCHDIQFPDMVNMKSPDDSSPKMMT